MSIVVNAESTYRGETLASTNGTHGDNQIPTSLFPRSRVGLVEGKRRVRWTMSRSLTS